MSAKKALVTGITGQDGSYLAELNAGALPGRGSASSDPMAAEATIRISTLRLLAGFVPWSPPA
jgi:hypothetical protein